MTAQQLKNSILQMAVQGKLVPQDPNDEPASVLLERIKAEKQELIKAGKIKKDKKSSEIFRGATHNLPYAFCEQIGKETRDISDEIPFEIPDSWEWVHLDHIAISDLGKTLDKAKNTGNFQPYLCSINVYWNGIDLSKVKEARFEDSELPKYLLKNGDLLICEGGEVGRCCVWDKDIPTYYQNALHRVRFYGNINPHYFKYLMELYKGIGIIEAHSKGVTIKHLVQKSLNSIYFPLPPLSEQHRIVAKIEELLPYIEKYGKAEEHLTSLNTTFPEALKKSILQEAVQGKLVPQNSDDEPASVLLERIRAEKQALVKAGKIKKNKPLAPITEDEIPFEIPESWKWVRLGTLCDVVTGRLDANAQTSNGKYAFFTCGVEVYKTDTFEFDCDAVLLGGNNASGDYKIHRYCGKFNAYQRVYVISGQPTITLDYINQVIRYWLPFLKRGSQGTTTRFIKLGQVTGMMIPFPPLSEQKRIIARIKEILPMIDSLKQR